VEEEINQAFIQEMEARIAAGRLAEERHRIYWFAWIPTYTNDPFDLLKENRIAVPLCENFRIFWDEIDEENPFEGLAMKCLKNPFAGATRRRTWDLAVVKEEYGIDGSILFATPACRHSKSANRLLMEAWAEMGVPFLTLDMDICDPRTYAPAQVRTRLEGFAELLDQKRGPRHMP
jgi:benzoyl-CoA reductase/2-hydroxyglutaryl-CoA dehydratase subunit BcrC/BadD/HgdB